MINSKMLFSGKEVVEEVKIMTICETVEKVEPLFIGKAKLVGAFTKKAPIYKGADLARLCFSKQEMNYYIGEKPTTNNFIELPKDANVIIYHNLNERKGGRSDYSFEYGERTEEALRKRTFEDYQMESTYNNGRFSR